MGLLEAVEGQRIYLDTNIWIYALEDYPKFLQHLTELFAAIDRGEVQAVTSEFGIGADDRFQA